ncbi:M61 family metallopeptidase [soil metagenome]
MPKGDVIHAWKGLIAAIALAFATPALAARPAPVSYDVSPRFDRGALSALDVRVAFKADADGETRLSLPSQWMGHDEVWRNISDLHIDGAITVVEDGPNARIIRSRPGQALVLRYRMRSRVDHEPTESDGYPAEPWVRPTWFYVDGQSALVTIEGREAVPLRLRWRGWPASYRLASNLEDSPDAGDPRQSMLIGGQDVRVVRSGPVRLAIRGPFTFDDDTLARELATILRAERGFFGDAQDAPYLVTVSAIKAETGAQFVGTGKIGGFAMVATPNMTLDDIRILLGHEIFHAWNPGRLGKVVGPTGYWLSEGFTDFYARRLLQRERLVPPAKFVALWNETLREYGLSTARTLTGAQAAERFWTDPDAGKLAYQRGALLAVLWDQRLRQAGSSLDDAVLLQARTFPKRQDVALADLFADSTARLGVDVRGDILAHIDQGRPIALPADAFAPCASVRDVSSPVFELGFTPKVDARGVMTVTDLKADSAAARTGLRDGMILVQKIAGANGDALRPYELQVSDVDGGTVRTVRFLPQGAGSVTYPQLVLDPSATRDPRLCDFPALKP